MKKIKTDPIGYILCILTVLYFIATAMKYWPQ